MVVPSFAHACDLSERKEPLGGRGGLQDWGWGKRRTSNHLLPSGGFWLRNHLLVSETEAERWTRKGSVSLVESLFLRLPSLPPRGTWYPTAGQSCPILPAPPPEPKPAGLVWEATLSGSCPDSAPPLQGRGRARELGLLGPLDLPCRPLLSPWLGAQVVDRGEEGGPGPWSSAALRVPRVRKCLLAGYWQGWV